MVSQTNELAFEQLIERRLTGQNLEALGKGVVLQPNQGYQIGQAKDFNPKYAIDNKLFWEFLQATQALELAKIQKTGADWQQKILDRFDRLIKKDGIVGLLKKGFQLDDAEFCLLYPAPLASSADSVKTRFAQNIFSCTRQVRYSLSNPAQEIDMVLFVNGIPLITLELKNAQTGQTARYHGIRQYCQDRDNTQPLLQFGRCIVHMAVDTEEVFMTTKLNGKDTFFLPFNQGNNFGAGNPINPNGHKTAYLWDEIFSKTSLINIIAQFVRIDGDSKTPLPKRDLYFPRYHQLDVVRRLVEHSSQQGVGHTYLIQHSAGSGKSNSITWAAFQLIETYPAHASVRGAKSLEHPLFDTVIVVTDRRLLDKQIRDNIKAFSDVKNIVAPAYSSAELRLALEQGKKIIVTTLQKFHFILDGMSDMSQRTFAVIIDEAHSSQGGTAASDLNNALGGREDQDDVSDLQDLVLDSIRARKMRKNASYFAFTATPKRSTLEKFGEKQPDGTFKPFHLYSMKQAIEEGFILDVLTNYTTYQSYYEIQKSIEHNPAFNNDKAQKILRAYVEKSMEGIENKAEVIVEHFLSQVVATRKLKGKAKGMVVTHDIASAIRYFKAIQKQLEQKGSPFKALLAFSGEKQFSGKGFADLSGTTYSEASLNGFAEAETKDQFDTDTYRLLIVANKYLTGFDQPKLCAMYVDKKLQDVLAVQTLSRLNRSANKLGKRTEDLFVLDFFNTVDDIKASFDPFYTSTTLSKETDINVLHDLKNELDNVGVYEWHEVEAFIALYFKNADADQLSPILNQAAQRFKTELVLTPVAQADFKIKAKHFVKVYAQIVAIRSIENVKWEQLFWFLKFLIPLLPVIDQQRDQINDLLELVDLSTYGLERKSLNAQITLKDEEAALDPAGITPRGAHEGEDEPLSPLDEIIKIFNERWFAGWNSTPEDKRVKLSQLANKVKQHPDFASKYQATNNPDNKLAALSKIISEVMLATRRDEMELYKLFATDEAFKLAMQRALEKMVNIA